MSARPASDRKKTELPKFRMSKGEMALLQMKASLEGVGMSELVRRAVEAYQPTPKLETCIECGRPMVPYGYDKEVAVDFAGKEYSLIITGVPAKRCECGEITYDLDMACAIEELVYILVKDALRYNKEVPERMTVEDLFKEEYLGK